MRQVNNLDELVDFKLKALLHPTVILEPMGRRIMLPLIVVSVSPEVKSVEVEKVRLLNPSIDLDIIDGLLTLHITLHVRLQKKGSLLKKLIPSRRFAVKKSLSLLPRDVRGYWEAIYLGLLHRRIRVMVSEDSEDADRYIIDLYIDSDLEEKIMESFQRYVLEKLPIKIYSNPAYLNVLKSRKTLKKLSKKTLRELAEYGLISLPLGGGPMLTRFGRMYMLWAERRDRLLTETLINAEAEAASLEELEGALKQEEEESRIRPERLYPCLEEIYAEKLSEESVKRSILTPSQSYLAGRLIEYFSSSPDKPFIVYGVRGVGKTFTIRYVLTDNYRYTYLDKEGWRLKTIAKGEPTVEVFDDWHYLCEGVIRGLVGLEEFRSFLEKLGEGIGVRHVVLVSDEIPSAYLYKLPREVAGIVEELVGLTISWKINLKNVNILELEPSSITDYLKHIEGPESSKQFIEFLCKGRLRRLAKILKQFNGVPPLEMLIQWVGVRLGIDGDSSRLILAKLKEDEGELQKILDGMLRTYVNRLEKLKGGRRRRRRRAGPFKKKLKKRATRIELEKVEQKLEATFRETLFIIESNLPRLFDEEVWEGERAGLENY